MLPLSNCAYRGRPNRVQCSTSSEAVNLAVIEYCGQDVTSPPCNELPLSTVISIPPSSNSPETVSKESSSTRSAATSGKYQPSGGAVLRTRAGTSSTPLRLRIRPIVRIDGGALPPRSAIAL